MGVEDAASHDNPPTARLIKAVIRQRIAEGATAAEIKNEIVSEFGPDVLSIPTHKKRLLALHRGLLSSSSRPRPCSSVCA